MSKIIHLSESWKRIPRKLVIFGDSYSSISHFLLLTETAIKVTGHLPRAEEPLGEKFPGLTWNEENLPNWIGHYILNYCTPPRFPWYRDISDKEREEWKDDPILVYDYARGGDKVEGVTIQVRDKFLPHLGTKPEWAPWNGDDTLFITSVGINDCAFVKDDGIDTRISVLFSLQGMLYASGARNFLFMDVPPTYRFPQVASSSFVHSIKKTVDTWNTCLESRARKFSERNQDCTVLMHSWTGTFNKVLDNPEEFGFSKKDPKVSYGGIWHDHLHPTSKVHEVMASDLGDFLGGVGSSCDSDPSVDLKAGLNNSQCAV